jgi:hypothetical protein
MAVSQLSYVAGEENSISLGSGADIEAHERISSKTRIRIARMSHMKIEQLLAVVKDKNYQLITARPVKSRFI